MHLEDFDFAACVYLLIMKIGGESQKTFTYAL